MARLHGSLLEVIFSLAALPTADQIDAGWRSQVSREAHNLKIASSNLAPATFMEPRDPIADPFGDEYDTDYGEKLVVL